MEFVRPYDLRPMRAVLPPHPRADGRPKAEARRILSSNSTRSGTISISIVTGSTPGSSVGRDGDHDDRVAAVLAQLFRRHDAELRTAASTPTGIWNIMPIEISVSATNE